MKKTIITIALTLAVSVGAQAFAFEPNVGGHRTLALEDAQGKVLVIGGKVERVDTTPELITWIQAKIFDLQIQLNSMPKDECNK